MLWLPRVVIFFEAIHKRTDWRLPKFISVKVGLLCLRRFYLGFQRGQALDQLRIRRLRIRYLQHQLAHREFDIGVSTALRRTEKLLDSFSGLGDLACRAAGVPRDSYRVLDRLKVDFHGKLLIASLNEHEQFSTGDVT